MIFKLDKESLKCYYSSHKTKKDDPILKMTPKQVTHVRICQNLPETAAYSSTTTEDQHVVKMINPVKASKNYMTNPV